MLGLFDNQDIPFMTVRRAVHPDFPTRPVDVAAAHPVDVQYFHASGDRARTRGAAAVERPRDDRPDDELFFRGQLHPLSVSLLDDGRELWGEISYKSAFYDEATIDRIGDGRDPALRLSALPVPARS